MTTEEQWRAMREERRTRLARRREALARSRDQGLMGTGHADPNGEILRLDAELSGGHTMSGNDLLVETVGGIEIRTADQKHGVFRLVRTADGMELQRIGSLEAARDRALVLAGLDGPEAA